jgi:hypothetical protein
MTVQAIMGCSYERESDLLLPVARLRRFFAQLYPSVGLNLLFPVARLRRFLMHVHL